MWAKFTKGCLNKLLSKEDAQGILEYVLIVAVVVSAAIFILRPFFDDFKETVGEGIGNTSIFSEDDAEGGNFYYFPVSR